jgi:hypothetical protein
MSELKRRKEQEKKFHKQLQEDREKLLKEKDKIQQAFTNHEEKI